MKATNRLLKLERSKMNELKPVDTDRLNELISKRESDNEPSHEFWFVGPEGEPFWSQGPLPVSLMTNLVLQPHPDYPEYKILDFESSRDHEDITIVRVEEVQCSQSSFDELPGISPHPNYVPLSSRDENLTESSLSNATDISNVEGEEPRLVSNPSEPDRSRFQKLSRILKGILNFRGIL